MFDFITSYKLTDELKTNEIYELFKTDSFEFNKAFLSNLEKFPGAVNLIEHYTNIDEKIILNVFDNILLTSYKTMKAEEEQNNYIPELELYTIGVSKILFLLFLIQKANQLQTEIINHAKYYTKNFYKTNKKESFIKEKIDIIINDLTSSQMIPKRSMSRRSTNDVTNTSISFHFENKSKMLLNKLSEKDEILESQKSLEFCTPKFEYNNSNRVGEENSTEPLKIDSSLTLQKMKFVQNDDKILKKEKNVFKSNKNNNILNNTTNHDSNQKNHRAKNKSCESSFKKRQKNKSFSTKEGSCFFFKKRTSSINSEEEIIQNDRRIILAELLDAINILYKNGQISMDKKINIKQIIISNPTTIIDKYFFCKKDMKNKDDNINIQSFLMKEFNHL